MILLYRVLPALVSALLAIGATVAITSWSPWENPRDRDASGLVVSPTPSPYQRRLTGLEAAGKAESWVAAEFVDRSSGVPVARYFAGGEPTCEAGEFNEYSKAWIVRCKVTALPGAPINIPTPFGGLPPGTSIADFYEALAQDYEPLVRVDDATGAVEFAR